MYQFAVRRGSGNVDKSFFGTTQCRARPLPSPPRLYVARGLFTAQDLIGECTRDLELLPLLASIPPTIPSRHKFLLPDRGCGRSFQDYIHRLRKLYNTCCTRSNLGQYKAARTNYIHSPTPTQLLDHTSAPDRSRWYSQCLQTARKNGMHEHQKGRDLSQRVTRHAIFPERKLTEVPGLVGLTDEYDGGPEDS